jgi:hypothetical protein
MSIGRLNTIGSNPVLTAKNNQVMKQALRFILLLLHIALSGVAMYYIGDYGSQPINILLILLGGLVYSAILITISLHVYQFILSFKNKTTQL